MRQLVELVGDQSPSPEAPPRSKKGRSSGDVRRGAMMEGTNVGVIEGKEIRNDESIAYFPWRGKEVRFESQKVMAVEIPLNKQIFEERSQFCYTQKKSE